MTVWKSKIYLQIPSNPFPSPLKNIQTKFIKLSYSFPSTPPPLTTSKQRGGISIPLSPT